MKRSRPVRSFFTIGKERWCDRHKRVATTVQHYCRCIWRAGRVCDVCSCFSPFALPQRCQTLCVVEKTRLGGSCPQVPDAHCTYVSTTWALSSLYAERPIRGLVARCFSSIEFSRGTVRESREYVKTSWVLALIFNVFGVVWRLLKQAGSRDRDTSGRGGRLRSRCSVFADVDDGAFPHLYLYPPLKMAREEIFVHTAPQ